jgi:hypothetical protein
MFAQSNDLCRNLAIPMPEKSTAHRGSLYVWC